MVDPSQGTPLAGNRAAANGFDSVDTGDGFNSDIGDGVDYLDPRWLARSKSLTAQVDRLDDVTGQFTSGSGSASDSGSQNFINIKSGSTSDSKAFIEVRDNLGVGSTDIPWTWDKDRAITAIIDLVTTDGKQFVVSGFVDADNYVNKHVGVGIDGGDLVLSVSDGNNRTTETIVSGVSDDPQRVFIDFVSGQEASVETVNGDTATITTNLPSGTTAKNRVFSAVAENDSAVNAEFNLSDFVAVQKP